MSRRKVQKYIEAHREYVCYVQQRADYPELTKSAKHLREFTEAKALWLTLLRGLTGGELAVAREIERTQKVTAHRCDCTTCDDQPGCCARCADCQASEYCPVNHEPHKGESHA